MSRTSSLLTLLPLVAAAALGQGLQVTGGAAPYQVFQRDASNTAMIRVEGTAQGRAVESRLIAKGLVVAGFDWKQIGTIQGGKFKAEIAAVPVGGPYRLELRAAGTQAVTAVDNLLVGDLWVLAGQSNMEGVGNLVDTPLPSAMVNSFDMTDAWVAAEDPLHRLVDAVDSFHWRRNPEKKPERLSGEALDKWIAARKKGAGLGLPFALEMVRRTDVPIGLVPCAHGGTSMDQWSPALKDQGGASLYGGMIRRVEAVGGRVAGVLWYQGESDASVKAAPLFKQKLIDLINALRADTALVNLPFYHIQIGRYVNTNDPAPWNAVQQAQLEVESVLPNVGMTTCLDCELDDGIHVGTDSHRLLAARVANLAEAKVKRGPRPVSATVEGNSVLVKFDQINGHLTHRGRLSGFTIHDAEGKPVQVIYRQRISSKSPDTVELLFGGKLPEGALVFYGYGKDPYVNLEDSLRMSCPAFSMAIR
ncbi:MAG TPA: sialate O-acetylesterase [Bryobacteraceae bacterium]|mgnify:CR=1 FL=1|nr:sialate O-acetylesterase [Bryobacteraceae bacterium]